MPQFTIKLNTYDPAIVDAFERLRKSRKQAAFTHEALKHFLASEAGERVIALMSGNNSPPSRVTVPMPAMVSQRPSDDSPQDPCSGVLGKILE